MTKLIDTNPFMMILILQLRLFFGSLCHADKMENGKSCRNRNRPITFDTSDLYAAIDVTLGRKLILQCHYWYVSFVLFPLRT